MAKVLELYSAGFATRLVTTVAMICLGACGGGGGNGGKNPQDPPEPPLAADEVRTAEGVYKGSMEGNLRVFRGLRYAAPPVGDLRFKAPVAAASFTGTSASEYCPTDNRLVGR